MNSRVVRTLLVAAALLWVPRAAAAQTPSGCTGYERLAAINEQVRPGHFRLREKAEVTCDNQKFFADQVDVYTDEDRLVAVGNVLFTTPDMRITAARVEFNFETKVGTFFDASGSARVEPTGGPRSTFGTQQADMHFRGEKIEKLGPKKYRITNGGFTTCLQPTARWEFTSGTMTINVDRYAVARNTVFRVKGVPLLYLPIIYYPLDDDSRSTGFLLPTYGNSYFQGQTIRNAFFWAINRSMDLTLMHNWYSKTGSGYGGEFRFAAAPESHGTARVALLDERESVTILPDGTVFRRPPARYLQVDGEVVQQLPGRFRIGARANYFSDISTRQLISQNPYDFTSRESSFSGGISGQIAGFQLGASFNQRRYYDSGDITTLTGSMPQAVLSRPERTIGRLPIYWGFNAELMNIQYRRSVGTAVTNRDRLRVDFMPTLRAPLSRLSWLTAGASLVWRSTWWSRGVDGEPVRRNYFEQQITGTGPTFSRVFDTPGLKVAQRWKHIIQPSFGFSRRTEIENRDRILTEFDTSDLIVGSIVRFQYGLTNRLYARRGEGTEARVRDVAELSITQSYYTDAQTAQDDRLSTNPLLRFAAPSNFSPVDITATVTPVSRLNVQFRAEYEKPTNTFRRFSTSTTLTLSELVDVRGSWSKQRQPKESPFADDPYYNAEAVSGSMRMRTENNRHGATYSMTYDIRNVLFINQSVVAYYNPQCCGIAVEFQRSNRPNYGSVRGDINDRRFNISLTLAGIGTFSDIFGAFAADIDR